MFIYFIGNKFGHSITCGPALRSKWEMNKYENTGLKSVFIKYILLCLAP